MSETSHQRQGTWRKVLKAHSRAFLDWLETSQYEHEIFERISSEFSEFLIHRIRQAEANYDGAALDFWRRIPEVRACCDDPTTFEKPLAAEAYAYVHLLERYRRMWAVLKYLCTVGFLPMAIRGVRILDIGSGPGSSLFAIEDFYRTLGHFARTQDMPELEIPSPQLSFIERSQPMVNLYSAFRESTNRQGPLGLVFSDFSGLDFKGIRAQHQRQNETETWWDWETGEYEEIYDPAGAAESANRLHRYRLIVLSNFLTLPSDIERWKEELGSLFADLNPGAVVVLLGGTGEKYQAIYESVAKIATDSRLREADWNSNASDTKATADHVARQIKEAQHRVYLTLEELVRPGSLVRGKSWPDYWNAEPSRKARSQFAIRIFRRGRWPAKQ